MPPRINRDALTQEVGESLRVIAKRLAKLDDYSGDARVRELRSIQLQLPPLSARLQVVIDNCRAAGGSYPNYPTLRRSIQAGGERVYELREELHAITATFTNQMNETPELDFSGYIASFAKVGQSLKLVQFAPPLPQETPSNA